MHLSDEEYIIEQFTLEGKAKEEALNVLRTAFVNVYSDEGGTTEFTDVMFNILFGSPYMPRELFVRAVHKASGKVVGFVGGIPRDLYYRGRIYKVGFPSFLAVDPAHRKNRLAFRMTAKLIEIGQSKGFEAGVAFFEPEEHGISTGQAISREMKIPFLTVSKLDKFLIRVFDAEQLAKVAKLKWYEKTGLKLFEKLRKVSSGKVRRCKKSDGEDLYQLQEDFKKHTEMTLLREKNDFLWYLEQPGVNCVLYEDENGKPKGFATAFEFLLSGFGNSIKFGWIDIVHTYRLTKNESIEMIRYFALTSKEMGWTGLQTPFIPYFDPRPFKKANFIFYPKKLIIAFFPLKESFDVKLPVKSFYFDWR